MCRSFLLNNREAFVGFKIPVEKYIKLCRIACSYGVTVNTLLYKIIDNFLESHS